MKVCNSCGVHEAPYTADGDWDLPEQDLCPCCYGEPYEDEPCVEVKR